MNFSLHSLAFDQIDWPIMISAAGRSNVIDLAEERARRHARANSLPTSMLEIAMFRVLWWAAYWRWMATGCGTARSG